MSNRLFAAALVTALSLTACQGSPAGTPGAQTATPAKGMGIIKGFVTSAGVIAPGGGNYQILQAGGVAGATLQVQGGAHTSEVTTGADGSFSVQVPGGSSYTLTASHSDGKGGIMKHVTVVEVPLAEEPPIVDVASLVTRRTGSIQGVVALAGGADPEGADVFVPGTTIIGKVSAKGRFALANIPEGTWNIVFQKPGFKRAALTDLSVQAGRPLVLTEAVTLDAGETAGGQLKGLIRDEQGRAVVGASVTATGADGLSITSTSDGQGNVSLSGLADGTYRVQVYRSFYKVPPVKEVKLEGGQGGDLGTVSLASTVLHFGKISGRLLDEAGEPIDGAVVQLDPPTTEQVFTDARGNFTLDRVMPGEYTLRAAAGGFEVGERDVLVDNQPGFNAAIGDDFVLRQPFNPAKALSADRKAAKLMAPVATAKLVGNDMVVSWDAVGLPPGVTSIVYELEGEIAPGSFVALASTTDNQVTLKDFGNGSATFRLTARTEAEIPAATEPATYRTAQFGNIADAIRATSSVIITVQRRAELAVVISQLAQAATRKVAIDRDFLAAQVALATVTKDVNAMSSRLAVLMRNFNDPKIPASAKPPMQREMDALLSRRNSALGAQKSLVARIQGIAAAGNATYKSMREFQQRIAELQDLINSGKRP